MPQGGGTWGCWGEECKKNKSEYGHVAYQIEGDDD